MFPGENEPKNSEARKIDPSGIDEFGNLCDWSGFDKTEGTQGTFWGVPKVPKENNHRRQVIGIIYNQSLKEGKNKV